jgi:hypothetical protein
MSYFLITPTVKILTILFSLIFINSIGQHRLNGHDRLNKSEFEEVKKQKERFVPGDIKEDTIIIVRYSVARLERLNATSRNLEFARNGEDTTGYTDEFLFGITQVEKGRRIAEKRSLEFPLEQSLAVNKKGVKTLIVDESTLHSNKLYQDKYWLITIFINTQEKLRGSWITTMQSQFFDPRTGKYYDIFSALNHDLMELVE